MATKRVLLTRRWDGHEAGEIVEEWSVTADSMIRKGYGVEAPKSVPKREPDVKVETGKLDRGKGRKAETADAPPAAETAEARPEVK